MNRFVFGCLILLAILVLSGATNVIAARKMLLTASVSAEPTDRGELISITGKVTDTSNIPVWNALISVQVNNPQGSSIHIALAYSGLDGSYSDRFTLPPDSPAGNYTIYLVADKPGFDSAKLTLAWPYATPDFSISASPTSATVRQGESVAFTVTVISQRAFKQAVNLSLTGQPMDSRYAFVPSSLVPTGTVNLTLTLGKAAPTGSYNLTIIALGGGKVRSTFIGLAVEAGPPGPVEAEPPILPALVAVVGIGTVGGLALWRRSRKRRELTLEALLGKKEADRGYLAVVRALTRLEELKAQGKIDEETYQRLRREYEERLEKTPRSA